jgi:formate hydrogenlyase transcriptional activator
LGRFEQAANGTLFLDEVGELPLDAQVKLLRVLQEREFERVGGTRTIAARARIVAATNRDLSLLVQQGRFRADLYYRLHVFPIALPPLRTRRGDIPLLVDHFLRKLEPRLKRRLVGFTADSERRLLAHDWPGNIRELENLVERAALMSEDGHLELPPFGASVAGTRAVAQEGAAVVPRMLDTASILGALQRSNWKLTGIRGAAVALGIHPNTLRYRMRQLGIARPATAA